MIKDIKDVDACPECGSANINKIKEKNQVVCKECGGIFEPLAPKDEKKFEKASDVI